MPALVALAIRSIIQFTITLGISELAVKYILPPLNSAIASIMEFFGVPEETANDIMANEFLVFIEQVGIGSALIRAKLPIAVADRLGFTSKGWSIRKIPFIGPVAGKPAIQAAGSIAPAATAAIITEKATLTESIIATIRKDQISGKPPISTAAQRTTLYKQDAEKLLKQLTVDEAAAGAKIATTTMKKISDFLWMEGSFASLAAVGVGIWALSEVNKLINTKGKIIYHTEGENPVVMVAEEGKKAVPIEQYVAQNGSTSSSTVPAATTGTTQVKVFTGVISSGVLGGKVEFVNRQDDLINSIDELVDAARNNLSSWLSGLLGRVIYEIKIVSSITTKDGIILRGTAQKIVSSYTTKGTPRHKTMINKFAVLGMYILNDKGSRVKLAQITLGPTDATSFNPGAGEIASATATIAGVVTTTNIEDIHTIASSVPIYVAPTTTPAAAARVVSTPLATTTTTPTTTPAPVQVSTPAPVQVSTPAPANLTGANRPICTASNLSEFYTAQIGSMLSLSARGQQYESFGLGKTSLYTGTAEQNIKLLGKLQWSNGCN